MTYLPYLLFIPMFAWALYLQIKVDFLESRVDDVLGEPLTQEELDEEWLRIEEKLNINQVDNF